MEPSDHALPRHEITLRFAALILLVLTAATILRPMLVELDPWFTYLGAANCALMAVVLVVIHRGRARHFEAALLLAAGVLCILPLLLVSGGVNSQFALLIPIFPLSASMLSGSRLALITCAGWLALIAAFTVAGPVIADLTGEGYHRGKTISRGIWASLAVLVSTAFGCYYESIYQRLTGRLRELASSDHLTGIANRRALERAIDADLQRAARSGAWVSLLLLDVDHFKRFNDRYGHAMGDRCLEAIARGLQQGTRAGQDLAGRFGGEEFLVVLTDTGPDQAQRVAEKLRRQAARGAVDGIDGDAMAVTVTIGVASINGAELARLDTTAAREDLIARADAALYAGKAAGRNRVVQARPPAPAPAAA